MSGARHHHLMRMGIDDARQDRSPGSIQDQRIFRDLELIRRPNRNDAVTIHGHKAVRDGIRPCAVDDSSVGYYEGDGLQRHSLIRSACRQ